MTDGEPKIMTIANASALPSGPFEFAHRSLQTGLRAWVEAQTGHPLGYVEQLYTFADRGRAGDAKSPHSHLDQLSRPDPRGSRSARVLRPIGPAGTIISPGRINVPVFPARSRRHWRPRLRAWAKSAATASLQRERWQRAAITFGLDEREWNEELVLQRYELLYEAGLIPEAVRDGGKRRRGHSRPADESEIIAAFSRPESRGCAPRSNTVPWCSN